MVANKSPVGANGSPVEASASPTEANFRLENLTRDVLGRSGQTVAQNEACLVSLESSPNILPNNTKNTPNAFIDQKLCKFFLLGCQ
ncbi:hypothetical protein R1flu_021673 [Riccia fluitans]|uniref:Uncharacterized protein n=1 Tax=Riccia fluitans TaxID=41844 RepID=A0ABD1ZQF2_9MARC